MNRPFRTEPEASAELEDAALWYEGRRRGLGVEFLEAVDAIRAAQIARRPRRLGHQMNFTLSLVAVHSCLYPLAKP